MKLFRKNSNLCDHNPPTSQTDGQTTCDRNTALYTKVHRAVKTKVDKNPHSFPQSSLNVVVFIPPATFCLCKTVLRHRHTTQNRRNSFYERTDEASKLLMTSRRIFQISVTVFKISCRIWCTKTDDFDSEIKDVITNKWKEVSIERQESCAIAKMTARCALYK